MFAIVTGGNAGMGLITASKLCALDYSVTISVRTKPKGEEAISFIKSKVPDAKIDYIEMELSSFESVTSFARAYLERGNHLNLLVNNAGIMNLPFAMTGDGIEAQFQVNHLSHFLLVHYLLSRLMQSGNGRVVSLSSRAHLRWDGPLDNIISEVTEVTESTYDGWKCYARSKLANILFARSLASRFPQATSGVTFNSLHPGLVATDLLVNGGFTSPSAVSVEEGVVCAMYLSTSPEVANISGKYFHSDCTIPMSSNLVSSQALSDTDAEKMWNASLILCGLTNESYGSGGR